MIDGIKCTVIGANPKLLRQLFDFHTSVNDNTGEAAPYSNSRLGNLRLTLTQKQTFIVKGSLHKSAHNGLNSTDFGYSDLLQSIDSLSNKFELPPENFEFHTIEIGVNLNYPVEEITNNLLMYGTTPVSLLKKKGRREKQGMCFDLARYALKFYGKSQTRLRLEMKVKRMQALQQITGGEPLTFESLKDKGRMIQFGELLLDVWDKVMLREEMNFEGMDLKQSERELLKLGRYVTFWEDELRASPDNFRKIRAKFLGLQEQYKITNRKGDISRLTGDQWQGLLQA